MYTITAAATMPATMTPPTSAYTGRRGVGVDAGADTGVGGASVGGTAPVAEELTSAVFLTPIAVPVPHDWQKREESSMLAPHCGHNMAHPSRTL
jgi:hypothetical protein